VLFDRFEMENANMVIFGKSGGGKSYTVKLEILRSLMFGTQVFVIDPENEYKFLSDTVGGTSVKISIASPHHINPFDLPKPLPDESPSDVLRSHVINLMGLFKLMLGTLTPEEDAILDETINQTYAIKDITPETTDLKNAVPPLMSDFQNVLESMAGTESLAIRIKKYTEGTFAGFLNNPTNVELDNQLVVFSIRDMEEELRPIAMYLVLNFIWTQIRTELKKRILAIDEAWILMKYESGAAFLFSIAKRARKYYLGLTTISQDIPDFMASAYGKPIVSNSSLQLLLKQSPSTIDMVKQTFNLTDAEKFYLLESRVGHGLFFAGTNHVALRVVASYAEDQIITSDPRQILEIEEAKKELAKQN
ncbi:MAG: ATP-binding protein, partial [Candidatus Colwellbacteria bacterium]|nr:ATP-binding protein [Candidatus Colwellbacteria bacterium]